VGDGATAYVVDAAGSHAVDIPTWTLRWSTDQSNFVFAVGPRGLPASPRGAIVRSAPGVFKLVADTGEISAPKELGIDEPVYSVHGWLGANLAGWVSAVSWAAFDDSTTFSHQGNVEKQRRPMRDFRSNFSAVEISTLASPAEIFNDFVRKFRGATLGGVATIDIDTPDGGFSAVGQTGTFTLVNLVEWWGQAPFSVEVIRYEPAEFLLVVKTLPNHPLLGWRYWRVVPTGIGLVRLETGAIDKAAPASFIPDWFYLSAKFEISRLLGRQMLMWRRYMEAFRDAAVADGGIVVDQRWIGGEWDGRWEYVRTNICGTQPLGIEICH